MPEHVAQAIENGGEYIPPEEGADDEAGEGDALNEQPPAIDQDDLENYEYHEEHDWKNSDLVFLALNQDVNKRRTNKKGDTMVHDDFKDLVDEILNEPIERKLKHFVKEAKKEAIEFEES